MPRAARSPQLLLLRAWRWRLGSCGPWPLALGARGSGPSGVGGRSGMGIMGMGMCGAAVVSCIRRHGQRPIGSDIIGSGSGAATATTTTTGLSAAS